METGCSQRPPCCTEFSLKWRNQFTAYHNAHWRKSSLIIAYLWKQKNSNFSIWIFFFQNYCGSAVPVYSAVHGASNEKSKKQFRWHEGVFESGRLEVWLTCYDQPTSNNNNLKLCHASLLCSTSFRLSVPDTAACTWVCLQGGLLSLNSYQWITVICHFPKLSISRIFCAMAFHVSPDIASLLFNSYVCECVCEWLMHVSMLSPRGGGTPGRCGAFDFSEEFLVKISTMGPQNLVKSDQISPGVPSIYIENE